MELIKFLYAAIFMTFVIALPLEKRNFGNDFAWNFSSVLYNAGIDSLIELLGGKGDYIIRHDPDLLRV